MDPFIILYSLFGPFLIWPLEYLLPYPYIIEELFKVFVVKSAKGSAKEFILAGVLFALTETVLYTINVNTVGSLGLMFTRFITTSLLHSTTFLIIFKFSERRNTLLVGFLIATLIHYLYNRYIPIY